MYRVRVIDDTNATHLIEFTNNVAVIGRAPGCDVVLDDPLVSKRHGEIRLESTGAVYVDLESTNGSTIVGGPDVVALGGESGETRCELGPGLAVKVGAFLIEVEAAPEGIAPAPEGPPPASDSPSGAEFPVTVMASRADLNRSRGSADDAMDVDPAIARRFLRFVRDTQAALRDEARLLEHVSEFVFEAFPDATHLSVVVTESPDEALVTKIARSREGGGGVRPSRSVVSRVMEDGVALLYARGGTELDGAESVVRGGIEHAICAPLSNRERSFGAIQLDIREPGTGVFTGRDLDLLAVVASHAGLVLDNLRLYLEQRDALESTIAALVHSLSWKDPDTAHHSERVRGVAMLIGRELGLDGDALEVLSVAAILHDMGKQGVRDELLFKPGRLTPEEYDEVSQHATYTQEILDKIFYPAHLKSVPQIAAYHHERMDGNGTYGIPGEELPIQARIIGVADAFDAILSARAYKEGKPLAEALEILEDGRGSHWDGNVVDAFVRLSSEIIRTCYERRADESRPDRGDEDPEAAA